MNTPEKRETEAALVSSVLVDDFGIRTENLSRITNNDYIKKEAKKYELPVVSVDRASYLDEIKKIISYGN